MSNPLFFPMFAHLVLTSILYLLLTIMRAPSIWGIGQDNNGENPFAIIEKRTSANLSNQFEWPLFFYIACIVLMVNDTLYSPVFLWLSWLFVIGRITHSFVQIFTANIRLRGIVFTVNFLSVFFMWIFLLVKFL